MKILKKIAIALLIIFGLYLLIALFLPSSIKIERSIAINAPASVVFEQINTLKNWKSWSYWDNIDPAMKSEYSDQKAELVQNTVGKARIKMLEKEVSPSLSANLIQL